MTNHPVFSEIYMSIVKGPPEIFIDLHMYSLYLECQLLGKEYPYPPGSEDIVGIHIILTDPEEIQEIQERLEEQDNEDEQY